MTDIAAGAPKIDLGKVVNRTFGAISQNFLLFFVLTLVLYALPSYGIQFALTIYDPPVLYDPIAGLVVGLLLSLPSYIATGAVTHGAIVSFNEGRADLGGCISTGIGRMFPLFLLGLVTSLAIGLATLLLVIPGIIVAVMLVVAVPVMVVERLGISESMSRSSDLTRGNRWGIFLLGLVGMLIVLALVFGVGVLMTGGGLQEAGAFVDNPFVQQKSVWLGAPLLILANVIGMIISSSGVASLYYELRTTQEGVSSGDLAKVFD